jgi:exopolysaccharide production protein ExoY
MSPPEGSSEYRPPTTIAIDTYSDVGEAFENRIPISDRLSSRAAGFYRNRGKRLFDIAVAALMLVVLTPLMLVLTAIVAIGGGQPFYAHPRVGRNGQMFGCLKFRSMRIGAAGMLAQILASDPAAAAEWEADHKLSNDPRVTRIGAFLRKSSLDELPQLVNVLRGEMSLVGPRPITEAELFRYGPARSAYLAMRPGLTGPWQVQGRNDVSYDSRVGLDVSYARKVSLFRDMEIMLLTALSMLKLTGR